MERDLISWKTEAWKSQGMVAGYAGRMHDESGTNRLKNEVEVELCRTYAAGRTVLDVGVGTGRAAIPLARDGYDVTGVDISEEMLRQCAREAGALPLRLVTGDVAALPFTSERFDTICSLNVVVHFPHWQAILDDWRRVLAPGGRLVFDVHTHDHVDAVAAATGRPYAEIVASERASHSNYMLRVAVRDVFLYARANGLTVRALVPYAALFGGGNRNYWLDDHALLQPAALERLYSWFGADPALYAFALFLEQRVIGALTPAATGRMMIVLDDGEDAAFNDAAEASIAARDACIARGSTAADLPLLFGDAADTLRSAFAGHLKHEPNRVFLAMLLAGARTHAALGALLDLLPADARRIVRRVEAQRGADAAIAEIAVSWAQSIPAEQRSFRGIDLSDALVYDATRGWLEAGWFAAERDAR